MSLAPWIILQICSSHLLAFLTGEKRETAFPFLCVMPTSYLFSLYLPSFLYDISLAAQKVIYSLPYGIAGPLPQPWTFPMVHFCNGLMDCSEWDHSAVYIRAWLPPQLQLPGPTSDPAALWKAGSRNLSTNIISGVLVFTWGPMIARFLLTAEPETRTRCG